MKTVFINASPKKKLSVSGFFLKIEGLFVRGCKTSEKLRNKSDHERILTELKDADTVVFCLPLYVDGVPSHVISFMKDMELFCKANNLHLNVYVISNSGFIEGNQNRVLLQVFENFCARSGIRFCGGIGIGGGVLLNVLRIMLYVLFGVFLLSLVVSGIREQNWFPMDSFLNFIYEVLIIAVLSSGVLWHTFRMGICINRGHVYGKKYTRVLLPTFLFIALTNVFFTVISLFQVGIFKGWFSKKLPSGESLFVTTK
jgi:hypothetical protein